MCIFQFKKINSRSLNDDYVYLYSPPTVDEFFDGIDATFAKRAFNSPIALPGFRPYMNEKNL